MKRALLCLLLPAAALAQPSPDAPKVIYEFPEESVEGRVIGPDGMTVEVQQRAPEPSLIRVRTDFYEALVQSGETL